MSNKPFMTISCPICRQANGQHKMDCQNAPYVIQYQKYIEKLEKDGFQLSADQCRHGYGDDYGHHRCKYQDRIAELEKALSEAQQPETKERYTGPIDEIRKRVTSTLGPIDDVTIAAALYYHAKLARKRRNDE